MIKAITCPRCHRDTLPRVRFCRHCGTALKPADIRPAAAESPVPLRQFRSSAWTRRWIAFAGIGAAAAIAVTVIVLQRKAQTASNIPDPGAQKAKVLMGAWLETQPSPVGMFAARRLTLSCNPDMTFSERCDVFQGAGNAAEHISFSGTWQLEGGILTCVVDETTRDDLSPRGTWRYAVLSLNSRELVLRLDDAPTAISDSDEDRIIYFGRLK